MSKKEAAEKYFKLGEQKYNKKDYQGAIADYDKAIELNPKEARAYYNRGVVKDELKQYKEAIADYDKAIELNPKYFDALKILYNGLNNMKCFARRVYKYALLEIAEKFH